MSTMLKKHMLFRKLSKVFVEGFLLRFKEEKRTQDLSTVLKWWRNRTERPLSPRQIHRKIIWMLRKFHKTTSEHWWRTPGTQKGSLFSSKEVGQNIKDKKRDKRIRDENQYQGGIFQTLERRSFQTPENSLNSGSVGSFGISEGNIIGRKKQTKNPQFTCLTTTPRGEIAQMIASASSG